MKKPSIQLLFTITIYLLFQTTQAQNPTRKILLEEFTGAWCGLCPQGFVFMDSIKNNFDNIIGVAIHQGDPMTFPAGNDVGMEYTGGGVPAFMVDRYSFPDYNYISIGPDYTLLSDKVAQRQNITAPLSISIVSVSFDQATNMANVSVRADFYENLEGKDLRFNLYVVEDNVSSSAQDYNQSNFFGGVAGHPFANLGGSISNFNHRYVCRSMAGGAWGAVNSIPTLSHKLGDSYQFTFQVPLANVWKKEDISFIALVQQYSTDVTDRAVLNAEQISFDAAINGNQNTANAQTTAPASQIISVYPNPVLGNTKIEFNLQKTQLAKVYILNSKGQIVSVLRHEMINKGMHTLHWNTGQAKNNLTAGMYFVVIETSNGERSTQKMMLY